MLGRLRSLGWAAALWTGLKRGTASTALTASVLLLPGSVSADTLRVAVASNFAAIVENIAADFERDSGHAVSISLGSTGKHYAQIVNGAPFDVFLAADAERPERLEREGLTVPDSRFTYAVGRLVAWAPRSATVELPVDLALPGTGPIAIANPRLAPYGRAARETLVALGLWESLRPRLVRGENIGQAFQFVHSGGAGSGFVAASQLIAHAGESGGSRWEVPAELHKPIEQQAVQLRDSEAARAFMRHLRSTRVRQAILEAGYRLP